MTSVLSSREYADLRCKVACGLGQAGVPLNHRAVARVGGAGVALPCPTAGASMIIRDFAAEGRGWCDSRARCACRDVRPRGAFVVVGPTTTLFRRRWANHDIRGPGAGVPAGASGPGVTAAPALGREVSDAAGCPGECDARDSCPSGPAPAGPGGCRIDVPCGQARSGLALLHGPFPRVV